MEEQALDMSQPCDSLWVEICPNKPDHRQQWCTEQHDGDNGSRSCYAGGQWKGLG